MDPNDSPSMYARVARAFALRVMAIFKTEDTLKEAYQALFPAREFDRTVGWDTLLHRELTHCWHEHGPVVRSSMVPFDELIILQVLGGLLDYNLYTQVHTNLQPNFLLRYRDDDAQITIKALQGKWEGKSPSPFDTKPKMFKVAAKPEEVAYNRDLSTLKALRIVAGDITAAKSFRVTPVGSTPAFADSRNLSMLGVGGDIMLNMQGEARAYYFCWDAAPEFIQEVPGKDKTFTAPGISYEFESKSGGDMLNSALYGRYVAANILKQITSNHLRSMLPRLNSVLVVTSVGHDVMEKVAKSATTLGMIGGDRLRFFIGARPDPEVAHVATQ